MRNEMFDIAILCGGLGTRLGKLTENIPKSMVEIEGMPFIWHQLSLLKNQGFEKVVLCLGHMSDQIVSYVEKENFDLDIKYTLPPQKRGTGGDIKFALPDLGDNFFVMYGDTFLPTSFRRIQARFEVRRKIGAMAISRNENNIHPNNVLYQRGKILEYSKKDDSNKNCVDYGISIFNKKAFDEIEEIVFSLGDVFENLIEKDSLDAAVVRDNFYEIGTQQSLKRTKEYFKQRRLK